MGTCVQPGVHKLKQRSVQPRILAWATVLFIVTSKSIYSTINGCYVNSPTPIFIEIFLLHMHGVVHSSALALCTPGATHKHICTLSLSLSSAVCVMHAWMMLKA